MRHSLSLNFRIEGDIPQVLETIRILSERVDDIKVPIVEVTGINLYKEDNFSIEAPQVATEAPSSLDEEQ